MNDIITNPISEQAISIDKRKYSIEDFLKGVDGVLSKVEETGDFEVGARFVMGMGTLSQASGLSLAKLLHGLLVLWKAQNKDEDEFFDYYLGYTNISRITMERYINAWDALETAVPDEYVGRVMLRPMRDLVKVGEAWSQGYKPKDDEWDDLLKAQNHSEWMKVLRGVKNSKPRKSSLTLYLERNGEIWAIQGDTRELIGSLNLSGNQKAIERIVKNSGMIRR